MIDGYELEKQVFECFITKPKYLTTLSCSSIRFMMLQYNKQYNTFNDVPSEPRIRNVLYSWVVRGWLDKTGKQGRYTYSLTPAGLDFLTNKFKGDEKQ